MPKDEIRKAKILYIRNAIAEFKVARASMEGFCGAQKGFSLLPVFRPVIGAQQKMIDAQLNLAREKIQNAIDVWKDDLVGETFNLDF